MLWSQVCKNYPDKWVVIKALSCDQVGDEKTVEGVLVLDAYVDSAEAWYRYKEVRKMNLHGDFLIACTANVPLKIKIQRRFKVRQIS